MRCTLKGLFHPAFLARAVSWFAFAVALFMEKRQTKRRHVQGFFEHGFSDHNHFLNDHAASQKIAKTPFTRERNRSVPSSFQFLERKNRLFTRERNDCISVFVSVHTGTQSFRSTVFPLVLASFSSNNYIHACV